MNYLRIAALCLSVVLLVASTVLGMLMNYLFMFLLIAAVIMLATVAISIFKKQVCWNFSDRKAFRAYAVRGLLRNASWIVIGICVHIALIPIQFSTGEFTLNMILIWGSVATLCLLDWVPREKTSRSLTVTLFMFLAFLAVQLSMIVIPPRSEDHVEITPPFTGNWYVFHGGNSALLNHHYFAGSQKYALDLILAEDGKLPLKNVTDLKQYRTFGSVLYSPVDGEVVAVENSLPDQKIGESDLKNLVGNYVVIKTKSDIFLLMAHLQYQSVEVTEGDYLKFGQEIAKIGNSGNTSQPHLHIQAMTEADFLSASSKPVPLSFAVDDERPRFYKRNDLVPGFSG